MVLFPIIFVLKILTIMVTIVVIVLAIYIQEQKMLHYILMFLIYAGFLGIVFDLKKRSSAFRIPYDAGIKP